MRESVQRPKSLKAGGESLALHFVERRAAGVGGGDQRADAGPGDEINRNFVFFQHAQDADVRNAARESAAERQSDLRTHAFTRVGERPQALYRFIEPFRRRVPIGCPPHLPLTLANFTRCGAFPVDRWWRFCNDVPWKSGEIR